MNPAPPAPELGSFRFSLRKEFCPDRIEHAWVQCPAILDTILEEPRLLYASGPVNVYEVSLRRLIDVDGHVVPWEKLLWVIFNIDTGHIQMSSLLWHLALSDEESCVDRKYPTPVDIDPPIYGCIYSTSKMNASPFHCSDIGRELVEKHSRRHLNGYDLEPRLEYVSLFLALKQRLP